MSSLERHQDHERQSVKGEHASESEAKGNSADAEDTENVVGEKDCRNEMRAMH